MKKIWAPWRMEYIKQPKEKECFICRILQESTDKDLENLVLFRGKQASVILNRYPYIAGHLMVVPNSHLAELQSIPKKMSEEMWLLTTQAVELLKQAIEPDGFNIGMNLGESSGAGLRTHVHIHIVPRWANDTNFMPVIANTKAISQALEETYTTLAEYRKVFVQKEK